MWELRTEDPQRALGLAEEAVRLAREVPASPDLAASLCLPGEGLLSRHEEARGALTAALALSRRAGDRCDYGAALDFHTRSLDQSVRIGDTAPQVSSLCNIGGDFVDLGRDEGGIEAYGGRWHWGRPRKTGKRWPSPANMGSADTSTGRQVEALECHRRALYAAKRLGRDRVRLAGDLASDPALRSLAGPLFPDGPARALHLAPAP